MAKKIYLEPLKSALGRSISHYCHKLMILLINQVLFSFEMRKYVSFPEMNMILMTITKAQLTPFVHS